MVRTAGGLVFGPCGIPTSRVACMSCRALRSGIVLFQISFMRMIMLALNLSAGIVLASFLPPP